MSKIEWGPEIKVDGKRPEWLENGQRVGVGTEYSIPRGIWYGAINSSTNWYGYEFSKEWVSIVLPADHPYYVKPEPSGADDPAYSVLRGILDEAYQQAASGKGKERHANGKPWNEQPIAKIGRMVGIGFNLGQVMKKAQEASRMDDDAACRELLGAIVYAASAIMLIREREANLDA